MFTTTTIINKDDIPRVSVPLLLDLYKQELEYQEVSDITRESNTLRFLNDPYKFTHHSLGSKFSNFFSGQITIEETTQEYVVIFEADMSRLLVKTGIFAAMVCLIFWLLSAFNSDILMFALLIFIVFSGSAYALTVSTFPDYFNRLKGEIEDLLYNEMRDMA